MSNTLENTIDIVIDNNLNIAIQNSIASQTIDNNIAIKSNEQKQEAQTNKQ